MGGGGDSNATTYYVSPSGDDGNAGNDQAHPWRTLQKVNGSSFHAGDTILLQGGGRWRETLIVPSSGGSGSPITFGAYGGGAKPILDGAAIPTGWTNNSAQQANTWKVALTTQPRLVWFDTVLGTSGAALSDLTASGAWYWNANVLYVYATANPDTAYSHPGIEASQRQYCVNTNRQNDVVLDGFSLTHCDGIAMLVNVGSRVVVRNLTISHTGTAIAVSSSPQTEIYGNDISYAHYVRNRSDGGGIAYSVGNSPWSRTYDNTVSHTDSYGIAVVRANSSGSVDGNTITDVGQNVAAQERDGIILYGNNLTAYRNTIRSAGCASTDAGVLSTGSGNSMERNVIFNGMGHGVYLVDAIANTLAYNLVYGNRYGGISLRNGGGHALYNNTVSGNGASGGNGSFHASNVNGVTVENNIFAQYGGTYEANIQSTVSGATMDHNLYYHSAGGEFLWWKTSGASTLADWQIKSQQDANSLSADPKFCDAASGDFHLLSGSPAVDAGTPVPGLSRDLDGTAVPQGAAADMGAYETLLPAHTSTITGPAGTVAKSPGQARKAREF